jgi:hypothetical protein
MNTGSRDERQLIHDVHRIANAVERIAKALDKLVADQEIKASPPGAA